MKSPEHDLCLAFDESSRLTDDGTITGAEATASIRHWERLRRAAVAFLARDPAHASSIGRAVPTDLVARPSQPAPRQTGSPEPGSELRVPVAEQKPEATDTVFELHGQVAGLLRHPVVRGMHGVHSEESTPARCRMAHTVLAPSL